MKSSQPFDLTAELEHARRAVRAAALVTRAVQSDLVHASTSWAVTPEQLALVEIESFDLQAFAVAADGASAYILATDGDYPASAVFQVALDSASPPTPMVSGLTTRERTLERIGDRLWIGDAELKNPRLRGFDLSQDPAVEDPAIATPGDPYLFLPIP